MIFLPLRKVDAAQRLIYARVDETPDRVGDVMDYASTKPQYVKWSAEMQKASGGKSLGNVRAMHQLTAAGTVQGIEYDDSAKAIDICIKVVDDDAWRKCEDGVYTGISPGGRYLKRWNDGRYTRYTGEPHEISLVDRPMIPTATFTMVKADGGEEQRSFKAPDELKLLTDDLLAASSPENYRAIVCAQPTAMIKAFFKDTAVQEAAARFGMRKADYSSDEREAMAKKGEAMPDGSFPIGDKEDLKKAVQAHGRAKDKDAVKAHIVKRAKALKATDELPEDWEGSTKKPMKKGLGDVMRMTALIDQLTWLAQSVTADAVTERDGSPLPAELCAWLKEGVMILGELTAEETTEALTGLDAAVAAIPSAVMAKAQQILDMHKAGVAISKANMTHVQAIHDHARDLGADCGAGGGDEPMAKIAFDLATLRGDNAMLKRDLAAANAKIAELQKKPAEGGPRRFAVARSDDGSGASASPAMTPEIENMPNGPDKAAKLIRLAMENPQPPSAPRRQA